MLRLTAKCMSARQIIQLKYSLKTRTKIRHKKYAGSKSAHSENRCGMIHQPPNKRTYFAGVTGTHFIALTL